MNRPRLFLSAVSSELRTVRQRVAVTVRTLGFDLVSQDDFPTGHGELRQWLREQIDTCAGLIQIVGEGYGAESREVDADYGRVSYTQFELLYARSQHKKTWLIIAGERVQRDTPLEQLDLSAGDADHPDPAGHQAQRRKLQHDYIARLKAENHLYYLANNGTELENIVLKLRDELGELRRSAERQQRRLAATVVAILCGVILLAGGGWWAYRHLDTSVQQVAVVNTEKIRAHLRETVEETHRRELADAQKATDWKHRQRLRDAVEAAHAARLAKIDDLAASFAEIEGRGAATSVFQEMTRILTSQGVDEAIAYVASQRTAILQTVRARVAAAREHNRADLQPLLRAAALHESKGQPTQARALYADILSAEPDWPDALHDYSWFLINQGYGASVRTTQDDARRDYDEANRLALHLAALDPGNARWRRDLSVSYERLGDVAMAQGKLDEAVRAYGDSLALRTKLAVGHPGSTEWQHDLSMSYNKLGDVAMAQGRLDEAVRAYTDGLAIATKLAAGDPGDTEWQRDLSVSYSNLGNVAVDQGRLDDAARVYGSALAIHTKLAAADPGDIERQRDLAVSYNKLGDVAVEQGKFDEAARAYGNGLTIHRTLAAGDPGNTEWQRDLSVAYSNLGDVAVEQGKLEDAARAYGEDLAITKKLAVGDPGNTEWQRDLFYSLFQISKLRALQKHWPDAIGNAEGALKIAERLSQLDRSNVTWQEDVKESRGWLEQLRRQAASNK